MKKFAIDQVLKDEYIDEKDLKHALNKVCSEIDLNFKICFVDNDEVVDWRVNINNLCFRKYLKSDKKGFLQTSVSDKVNENKFVVVRCESYKLLNTL